MCSSCQVCIAHWNGRLQGFAVSGTNFFGANLSLIPSCFKTKFPLQSESIFHYRKHSVWSKPCPSSIPASIFKPFFSQVIFLSKPSFQSKSSYSYSQPVSSSFINKVSLASILFLHNVMFDRNLHYSLNLGV